MWKVESGMWNVGAGYARNYLVKWIPDQVRN